MNIIGDVFKLVMHLEPLAKPIIKKSAKVFKSGKVYENVVKYSTPWFKKLSDEALKVEREIVRQKWAVSGNLSDREATNLYNLLHRFDAEMSRRDYIANPIKKVSDFRWTDANRWEK